MRRILVPVDFSPVTEAVMEVVTTMVTTCEAEVFVVHVAPAFVPDIKHVRVPQPERDLVAHQLRDEHRQLQALAGRLGALDCDAKALLVEGPGIVEKILDEASRLEADVIVMGSHGHGKLYDVLIGSICEGVLRRSSVPILVVPAAAARERPAADADHTTS